MTTEHVSVPREWLERLSKLDWFNAPKGAAAEICVMAQNILSRATPSESDLAIHMDRDAWRAAMIGLCQGAMSDVGTPDKAADHLRKRLAKAKPSAPRAVTSEMVTAFQLAELEYGERMQRSGIVFDPALSVEAGLAAALQSFATSLPAARVPDVKAMVERFLGWRLPKDFAPDGGVSFERHYTTLIDGRVEKKEREPNSPWWPVGTNLLTADQAEQMFRYVLAAAPQAGES